MRWALLTFVIACVGLTPPAPLIGPPVCTCTTIQHTDGWCDICKVGYLAGVKIDSALFFEMLDAHGHPFDQKFLTCERCKKLYESHGFCPDCNVGIVDRKLYYSKLTYFLARGELRDVQGITCPTCLKNTQKLGWCSACKVGMVGHRAYRDRAEFERTAKLREILIRAIPLAKECWSCALSLINDGTCLKCKKTYRDGERVPDVPP